MPHIYKIRVYYEDTDAGGVVYHANYLKFAERARSEMLRSVNLEQKKISEQYEVYFAVKDVNVNFISPAQLDDIVEIRTDIVSLNKFSMTISHDVVLGSKSICNILVKIAVVKQSENKFVLCKLPDDLFFIIDKLRKS